MPTVSAAPPYVICIDSDRAPPEEDTPYTLNGSVEGELLDLAQCLCNEPFEAQGDEFALIGMQFAVWMVSDGESFENLYTGLEEADGALGLFAEGELGELISGFMQFLQAPAEEWLDRCNIPIGE